MKLAGKQDRVQSGVAPSALPAHPLAAVLGDLLEATRSLAESVSVLVYYFLCLQIAWFCMLMPCYRQARRRRFGPPWRRRMILSLMTLIRLRTPPHQSCRGCGAGRYVKSFHLFGWRVFLALPGCHLHVVHGVSTPYEEAKNSLFCTQAVEARHHLYTTNLQNTQPWWSRRRAYATHIKSVAEFSESWGAEISRGRC